MEKLEKLEKLLNLPNDRLIAKEEEIKSLIRFLGEKNRQISVKIKINPKECSFCSKEIVEPNVYGSFACCKNKYVHKNCVIDKCLKRSPFLKELELNKRIDCGTCKKPLPFEFLKGFLEDNIREINKKSKLCIYSDHPIPENELSTKFCGHHYCKSCLKTWLAILVDAKEVNYESLKCKFKSCDAFIFSGNDIKTEYRDKYNKAEEFYEKITQIRKDECVKRCFGKPDCPKFIKNTPKPKYMCLTCEENL